MVAARVDGDAVVVVFRQDLIRGSEVLAGPIQGTRLRFTEFAEAILGPGSHGLDDVLQEAVLEIVEPHQPGVRLSVQWADGLCAEPEAVLWRPDAVAAAAAQARARDVPGCWGRSTGARQRPSADV